MTDNDDRLVFLDENVEDLEGERGSSRNWKVLIVDDDEDVHHSTVFAMQNVLILDRPLKFLHAYTAREAVDILMHESDIAVILLDVVMETDDAGLRTVDIIRNELHLLNVRIILRTGQPGQAPELEAITSYDINEYKTKNEFTRRKLFTSLTTAIRSYNQLQQLDASRQGLEKIIEASNSFISQQGLYGFAEGVITQISGLIGVVPEGLVCAGSLKKPEEGGNLVSQWVVIAAAGKFSGYMCQDINEIRDDKIVQALKASLDRKENILINKSVSLYFETPHKQGFAVYIASDHPIKEVDQQLIQIFCSNIALYADNITMVSRLQRQAYFDGLVNLPNRAALLRELDQSILEPRVDRSLLAIIDVDQFSAINYMLGPRYGDRLLRIIGQRLKSTYPDCYVARVSSDIFAVLGDANTITPFTIKEVFREPFRFQDVDHPLTVCCGIVTLTDVAGDGSDAIQCAYVALKRAKSLGLGQQARYSAAIANETNERTRLLHELHKAFGHDRLFPVFQPQLDLKTNKVCGFEALLRWRGEDNNYIPPSQFIPISEQSSIIISLGSWILRTSLLRLKSLHNLGYEGLRMSVNVSVVQLRQPDFVDVLEKALQDTGMEARDLELEITESIAAIGVVDVGKLLGAVRNLGVSVAIDDFGTGFSALSYLEKMPADRIKIDKTFIDALGRGTNGPKIAEMIIPLGHQMGMEVVAEGVEELEQLKLLRELGCDLIQGYYFAKPMAFEDLLLWLEKHKTAGK